MFLYHVGCRRLGSKASVVLAAPLFYEMAASAQDTSCCRAAWQWGKPVVTREWVQDSCSRKRCQDFEPYALARPVPADGQAKPRAEGASAAAGGPRQEVTQPNVAAAQPLPAGEPTACRRAICGLNGHAGAVLQVDQASSAGQQQQAP